MLAAQPAHGRGGAASATNHSERAAPRGRRAGAAVGGEYHFLTHWRVRGDLDEVAEILSDPLDLPRWWPSVYLDVRELEPAAAGGVGQVVELHTRGRLPYTLLWRFRVTNVERPHRMELEASGDFEGRGVWALSQEGPDVLLSYDWRVRARKPLLRRLSWLLRPLFSWNHRWAMAQGERSLRRELERRAAR